MNGTSVLDLFEKSEHEDGEGGVGDIVEGQRHTVHFSNSFVVLSTITYLFI